MKTIEGEGLRVQFTASKNSTISRITRLETALADSHVLDLYDTFCMWEYSRM
jgi:hypothetical protein